MDLTKSYFIGMVLIVVVFVLGTKMHERYMFPALILCLFTYIESRDRRFLSLFLGFSLTQYTNVAYTLSHLNADVSPGADGIVLVTAIANLALLLYMLNIGYDVYVRKGIKPLPAPITPEEQYEEDLRVVGQIKPHQKGGRFNDEV